MAYCRIICNRAHQNGNYPAMAVVAELNGHISKAHSGIGHWYMVQTRKFIESVLGGSIGGLSPNTYCLNRIGNCAEQHVADYLTRKMNRYGLPVDYKKIKFSNARRPRTMETFSKCENCKLLFD